MPFPARYAGTCHLCASAYDPGTPIHRWIGKYVHEDCRLTEIERRKATLEGAIEIPMQDPEKIKGYGYTTGWSHGRSHKRGRGRRK